MIAGTLTLVAVSFHDNMALIFGTGNLMAMIDREGVNSLLNRPLMETTSYFWRLKFEKQRWKSQSGHINCSGRRNEMRRERTPLWNHSILLLSEKKLYKLYLTLRWHIFWSFLKMQHVISYLFPCVKTYRRFIEDRNKYNEELPVCHSEMTRVCSLVHTLGWLTREL